MSDLLDEKLVDLFKDRHDPGFFSELYERYIDSIFRFIFISVRHKETAEDITSKVFMKVLTKINTFNASEGLFRTWLYGVARNSLVDHYRTAGKELLTDSLPELPSQTSNQDIEARTDIAMLMTKLESFLKELDDESRQILVLRLWDDIQFSEIAKVIGKSEGAVKMTFYRALTKVKGKLQFDI